MGSFTNTQATLIWIIAAAETIFAFVYMIMQNSALRRKIVAMGRLIPSATVVVIVAGNPGDQQYAAVPSAPPVVTVPPTVSPPAGFCQPQTDNPPSYSSVIADKNY